MQLIKLELKSLRFRKLAVFLTLCSLALSVTLLLGIEKIRVGAKVEDYEINLAEQQIRIDLNILPLGSYDVLIGMD